MYLKIILAHTVQVRRILSNW